MQVFLASVWQVDILVWPSNFPSLSLKQTGADGCICYLQYERDLQSMEFIGMKQVKELSAIRSVFTTDCSDDSDVAQYAVGFASDNFIIWNLTAGTKVFSLSAHILKKSTSLS